MLQENEIGGSMSSPVCPYDNSRAESVFPTPKKELLFRKKYATIEVAKMGMYHYIGLFIAENICIAL